MKASGKKTDRYLVKCADYNGYKNVLFMMAGDDWRLNTKNYNVMGLGKYSKNVLIVDGKKYNVFEDWSVEQFA